MKPWVVMRCYNDAAFVRRTLEGLACQSLAHRLIVFDNESTDGSLEIIKQFDCEIVTVPKGHYIPGRVLNQAMEKTDGPLVAFINSDCVPMNEKWLEELLAPFEDSTVAATFSRQVPRSDCWPLFAKDTEDTFGDGMRQRYRKHCFSMASSAIRRKIWEGMPFRTDIQYSEDIDWTWRARQEGRQICYAPKSIAEHSHNYTLAQWRNRQFGEGKADAQIFRWEVYERSFMRYSLLPFGRQVLSDFRYGIRHLSPSAIVHSVPLRWVQLWGRHRGFRTGLREGQP